MEPADLDVFVNVSKTATNFDEATFFASLLRENWRTADTLESTYHALVRLALDNNIAEKILPVLENKVKYGIFPDAFALSMLIDHFIESKNFFSATKVAHHIMLQEDFSHPISNILSLYSIYSCLMDSGEREKLGKGGSPEKIEEEGEANGEGEEEEEVYERVPYVRNIHFDDHFDLKEPLLLTGKSLYLFGKQYDDVIGRTSQIVGLSYYQKWDEALKLTEKFIDNRKEGVFARKIDELVTDAVSVLPAPNEAADNLLKKIQSSSHLYSTDDILTLVSNLLKSLPALESKDIENFKEILVKWRMDREAAINKQLEECLREETIEKIREIKKDLEEREKILYFFENEDRHQMELASATKRLQSKKLEELEEEYFPPTVTESLRRQEKPQRK